MRVAFNEKLLNVNILYKLKVNFKSLAFASVGPKGTCIFLLKATWVGKGLHKMVSVVQIFGGKQIKESKHLLKTPTKQSLNCSKNITTLNWFNWLSSQFSSLKQWLIVFFYLYLYIYIYIKREREREVYVRIDWRVLYLSSIIY